VISRSPAPAPSSPPSPRVGGCCQASCCKAASAISSFGAAGAHERLASLARDALRPSFELVTPIPYVTLQQMFDPWAPWGILGYEKAIYLEELTDGAIGVIVDRQPHKKSPMSFTPILCLGGAAAAQPDHAIAFGGRRSTRYVVNLAAIAQTSEDLQTDRRWVRDYWSALSLAGRSR
jgi:hypothetical protein